MNWRNLQQNKCPQCNKDFIKSLVSTVPTLLCQCGFSIGPEKYKQIVMDHIRQKLDKEDTARDQESL